MRACVISFLEKWDECLTLAEFSYNNSYQESIRMAPFEALYGKKCRTHLNWVEVGDRGYFGPYKVLGRCGSVAYRLQLPDILSAVHDVFHVSQLKKCL